MSISIIFALVLGCAVAPDAAPEAPEPSTKGEAYDPCKTDADCQEGLTCLEWDVDLETDKTEWLCTPSCEDDFESCV